MTKCAQRDCEQPASVGAYCEAHKLVVGTTRLATTNLKQSADWPEAAVMIALIAGFCFVFWLLLR